jgi:hypothetical protein
MGCGCGAPKYSRKAQQQLDAQTLGTRSRRTRGVMAKKAVTPPVTSSPNSPPASQPVVATPNEVSDANKG